jgi:hypothetical protein
MKAEALAEGKYQGKQYQRFPLLWRVAHLVYALSRIARQGRTFDWFGPNSLVPRWQDLWDILAMVKWFVGRRPKPVFDRWTYWQKFDYWAPFAAVIVIGTWSTRRRSP